VSSPNLEIRTATRRWRHGLALVAAAALVACGGGGGGSSEGTEAAPVTTPVANATETPAAIEKPASRNEAARFLTQASFGPTDAQVARLSEVGYAAWIDEQWSQPAHSHRSFWEAADAEVKAGNPNGGIWQNGVFHSFWKAALSSDDQLRQRVTFALSQIFVISMQGSSVSDNPRAATAYLDLLAQKSAGNYRDLLEAVAQSPMMGIYLSHLKNQKASAKTGRVPDENFAREVMQLFSIGLHELNLDGTPRLDGSGRPLETYTPADIAGLAKVFTGWSWDCEEGPYDSCFLWGSVDGSDNPDRGLKPMVGYAQFHSTDEKRFLGATIAKQTRADPYASLKVALDTLFNHPNVGPFIGKQLIQRLVTSNPSPAYVRKVAETFNDNGAGVRGDLKAVVKAVLMHPEARQSSATGGKLREPVLRLSAYLRAFPHTSDSGSFWVGDTSDAGTALGQSVLMSPSVFNFYRPGYVPPGTQAAAQGLAVPELQIAHETTAAGYVNYMRDAVSSGTGYWNATTKRRDLQPDFSAELALADQPGGLIDRVNERLMYGSMPAALKSEIQTAVEAIKIPTANANNATQVANAKRNRVNAAIFLTLVSPEFAVQK
jgi:uncharacterized protein (DUF1800 family)